ncbi:hypothetical protein [Umezawaea sp. Da 62-37]|uniref:hypothetical protein n=1 Tax=Umezawaea sp. Da 62-37 TaxID=3075927 RepID=UPI0028F74E27|nr:hypothetical protein [Umezawaea sp. Da 62-37]WNV90329.1 hypothetical protein RM788_19220 [Umezawaea sp. Da 62-37]
MLKTLFSSSNTAPAPVAEPSFGTRLANADRIAARALAAFGEAATDLENAAREQEMVAQEIKTEMDALAGNAASAEFQAAQNRASAQKLRELIG